MCTSTLQSTCTVPTQEDELILTRPSQCAPPHAAHTATTPEFQVQVHGVEGVNLSPIRVPAITTMGVPSYEKKISPKRSYYDGY